MLTLTNAKEAAPFSVLPGQIENIIACKMEPEIDGFRRIQIGKDFGYIKKDQGHLLRRPNNEEMHELLSLLRKQAGLHKFACSAT